MAPKKTKADPAAPAPYEPSEDHPTEDLGLYEPTEATIAEGRPLADPTE